MRLTFYMEGKMAYLGKGRVEDGGVRSGFVLSLFSTLHPGSHPSHPSHPSPHRCAFGLIAVTPT